jgi:hypothetical protein
LIATVIVAVSFFMNFMPMLFVSRSEAAPGHNEKESWNAVHTAMAAALALAAVFGVFLVAGPGREAITQLIALV